MFKSNNPLIIAEIGCNHMGNIEIAHDMIKMAAVFCKVDVVKFQKRTPKELLKKSEYYSSYHNYEHSFGKTYGGHREFLEFNLAQHKRLKKWCEEEKVVYSSSVWDKTAAKEIIKLDPQYIKIPSPVNLDFQTLQYIVDNYPKEIHLSFGMTTHKEEEKIVDFFIKNKRNKDLVLYACTSGYPVSFDDLSLLEIVRLKKKFGEIVKSIGFSGHHLGIAADIAAFTLGAAYIERHFTLDRTWKGTDQAASLEPDGMRKLVRDLTNISKALRYKSKEILDIEMTQRKKLKRKI